MCCEKTLSRSRLTAPSEGKRLTSWPRVSVLFPRPYPASSGPLGTGAHAALRALYRGPLCQGIGSQGLTLSSQLQSSVKRRGGPGLVARMEMKDLECSVPAPALWADSYFLLQLTSLLPLAWCPGLLLSGASSLPGSTLCSLCD